MGRLTGTGQSGAIGAVVLCLLIAAGWFAIVAGQPASVAVPLPVAVSPGLPVDDQTYFDAVQPRLRALATETAILVDLGRSRSRDAGALIDGQNRVQVLIREINLVRDERSVPDRFIGADADYVLGRDDAAASIRQARSALVRFDWDAMGRSVALLDSALAAFRAADQAMVVAATSPPGVSQDARWTTR
ncbi:MAG: hypothetical protein WKF80_07405 [Thermomicrobiales bacterium]